MGQLADKIRSKFPGQYDDMDDASLEKAVLAKHPEYQDLVAKPQAAPVNHVELDTTQSATSPSNPQQTTAEEPSMLQQMWNKVSQPLTDAPSRFADTVSHYVNPNSETTGIRGVGSAGIEALGHVISGLSSPLNLALSATGAGEALAAKAALPEIANALRLGTGALSIPTAIEGAKDLYNGKGISGKLAGGIELATSALGALHGYPEISNISRDASEASPAISSANGKLNDISEAIKAPITEPLSYDPRDQNPALPEANADTPKRTFDDKIYDLARNKFNMGQDNPELAETANDSGFNPDSLQGLEKTKSDNLTKMQQSRSAAMDARNPGFNGDQSVESDTTNPDDMNGANDNTNREVINNPNKPRFKLDSETGAGIPINDKGEQIGPAQFSGKELIPEAAQLSKYNQIGKMANESQKKSLWGEVRDANRAALTAFDFSAAGRQGKPLLLTKAYWTSFDDMFKSWGSERAYQAVNDSIAENPSFAKRVNSITGKPMPSLAERAGLSIGNAEQFSSNFAEKYIPVVRRSERAYNAFLNKLRADHFNSMVNDARDMGLNPDKNDVVLKQIGSFINDATGRGSLGRLDKAAPILNEVFFAPKLMASRVNMYRRWLDPRTYGDANPVVRKQALKSLLATVGFGMTVGELGRLAGGQVSNDPNSSDFRKLKVGNSRIDPFSGFQQYAVGASRLLSGSETSSTSNKQFNLASPKYGGPSRLSVAGQFMLNKMAPVPSLVASWMAGKDWDGKPFNLKNALLQRTVPFVMQDLYDIYKEDPSKLPPGLFKNYPIATKVGMSTLPVMGEGLQTYGR